MRRLRGIFFYKKNNSNMVKKLSAETIKQYSNVKDSQIKEAAFHECSALYLSLVDVLTAQELCSQRGLFQRMAPLWCSLFSESLKLCNFYMRQNVLHQQGTLPFLFIKLGKLWDTGNLMT